MWTVAMVMVAQAGEPEPSQVIDLLAPIRPMRCPAPVDADDIVVCGRRPGDEQRLFARSADQRVPPRAEKRFSDKVKGSIDGEAAAIAPGVQSNRLMFRLKMGF